MRIRGGILTAACLALGALSAGAAQLQDSGLTIRQLTSPSPEKVQVLVAAEAPHDASIGAKPAPSSFTLWLDAGAARDLQVSRNGARGLPLTTIFLMDESGSYKNGEHGVPGLGQTVAVPVIADLAASSTPGDKLGLIVFGAAAQRGVIRTNGNDFKTLELDAAAKRPPQHRTNLIAGLRDAIGWATSEGVPGLRDVVILTDGGDEVPIDPKDWDSVLADAQKASIRISVVVAAPNQQPKDVPAGQWMSALNKLADLARGTAGLYDNSSNPQTAAAALTKARAAVKQWLVLEGGLCGMKPGQGVDVRVEYVAAGVRKAWTGARKLEGSAWAPATAETCPSLCKPTCLAWQECIGGACAALACSAAEPCPAGAQCRGGRCEKPCPQCATWQECRDGACAAKVCQANEQCGAGAVCQAGACAPIKKGFLEKYLVWLLAGGGGLLLLIAALVLLRRKPEPVPPPAPEPLPAPVAIAEPEPEVRGGAVMALDPLPETHLEAIGGWVTPGERWRLHKPKVYVGGSNDPGDGNDIVFAMKQISGKHAMFELYPSGDIWVTDLGARNGTFVNGRKLAAKERARVRAGDQIKLSQQLVLKVVRPGADVDPPREPEPEAEKPAGDGDAGAGKVKQRTRFDPGNR